ncbi:ELL2 factor, partial [Brachypteracias leptosomus]|nr:ELL2 factor [Brachypteracias leptosomus]
RKYVAIDSHQQCQRYKDDFNAEYGEYRSLYAQMESVRRTFVDFAKQRKLLSPGTKNYKVKKDKT